MIHLISGKGGVGKSTVAAGLAWALASKGRRTLLVELGERSYFRHVFHGEQRPGLELVLWEGEACLREYLRHLLKIERAVSLFFDNKIMRALIQAAPALKELALLGRITSGIRHVGPSLTYDDIVVDAYATGHFRALWRAPMGMAEAIPFGPMGEQSRAIVDVLKNSVTTKFYVVAIPEELPVEEGLELARDIKLELNQKPTLVMNRWLSCPVEREKLNSFQGQGFVDFLRTSLDRQNQLWSKLELAGLPRIQVPWLLEADSLKTIEGLFKGVDL